MPPATTGLLRNLVALTSTCRNSLAGYRLLAPGFVVIYLARRHGNPTAP
ncbi:hypothetical protein I6E29_09095 [Arcanobacterium haemolyticum]|nr:hypothetical protein [Arcanobacterium haemolyticum]